MTTDSPEDRFVVAEAVKRQRQSEALQRRARLAATTSRIFMWLAVLFLAPGLFGMFGPKPRSYTLEHAAGTAEDRARAQYVQARIESGRGMALATIGFLNIGCVLLASRFARKWARAASESIASSESENRRVLQITRLAALPFAVFLRGFEEEGRSMKSLFGMPDSTKRVDKATRWLESEVVDELERRARRVFCIANPSDEYLLPGAIRLEANREHWLSEVSTLSTESEVVVVYLSAMSQGLLAELDVLRNRNLVNKSVVVLTQKIFRQGKSPAADFPIVVIAPSLSMFNQSAFGVIGQSRFRRELSASIDKAILQ